VASLRKRLAPVNSPIPPQISDAETRESIHSRVFDFDSDVDSHKLTGMTRPALTNPEIRKLKAAAQPRMFSGVVRAGKGGLTEAVLQSVEQALSF